MAQDSTAPSVIPKETLAQMDEALGMNPAPLTRPPGVFTRAEYERSVGIGTTAAKKRLSKLVAVGMLEVVEIKIPRTGGGAIKIPAYRMVAKKTDVGRPQTEAEGANASGLGTA